MNWIEHAYDSTTEETTVEMEGINNDYCNTIALNLLRRRRRRK